MNCCISAEQAQIHDSNTVADSGIRTVAYAEDISISADARSDITLSELDKDVLFFFFQTLHCLSKQFVQSLLDAGTIHLLIDSRGFLALIKFIDKIKFQSIQIPVLDGISIDLA